ncbi:MAG: hypothetical protein IBJ00_04805 [Alphaproteobacteria bacterium]|nr:hypothetical protein [Alphaproteobacteria bacterium]
MELQPTASFLIETIGFSPAEDAHPKKLKSDDRTYYRSYYLQILNIEYL